MVLRECTPNKRLNKVGFIGPSLDNLLSRVAACAIYTLLRPRSHVSVLEVTGLEPETNQLDILSKDNRQFIRNVLELEPGNKEA